MTNPAVDPNDAEPSAVLAHLPPMFHSMVLLELTTPQAVWFNAHLYSLGEMSEKSSTRAVASAHLHLLQDMSPDQRMAFAATKMAENAAPGKRFLKSCPTVAQLVEAAAAAVEMLPAGPARDRLNQKLLPFETGVAAVFYNRSDLETVVPDHLEDQLVGSTLDAALEKLAADFPHPWDAMASLVPAPAADRPRGG
jgi:hypothetical protein